MALKEATGGDGWSHWTVKINRLGGYNVHVYSRAEFVQGGEPKILASVTGIAGWPTHDAAIGYAERTSSEYAHRMSV